MQNFELIISTEFGEGLNSLASGGSSPKLANSLKTYLKNLRSPSILLKICMKSEGIFYIKMRILIKIKVRLMVKCQALISLKEIKKPTGKSLRVLAKN